MTDRVQGSAEPSAEQVQANDKANADALKAAADGGVVVNGEKVTESGGQSTPTERPENVPEKFWDAEKGEVDVDAVLASNAELQKQFTQSKQKDTQGESSESEGEESQQSAIDKASTEFAEKGELSDGTYEDLAKVGLSKEIVDGYIAGQKAEANKANQKFYDLAGGSSESYGKMVDWARENLTETEIQDFNISVENPATSEYAVQRLYARFSAEGPKEPDLVTGQGSGTVEGGHFKSSIEMQQAMADPRYAKDEAFRTEVRQKIKNAEKAGVQLF